jgi:hypothetical protein
MTLDEEIELETSLAFYEKSVEKFQRRALVFLHRKGYEQLTVKPIFDGVLVTFTDVDDNFRYHFLVEDEEIVMEEPRALIIKKWKEAIGR